MNHLAHSILSFNDQNLLMGNMITDFVSLKEANALHEDFQEGIALHRKIDKFMDSHPLTKEAIVILRPSQGKYAPVSIDLLWDYMLSNNWSKYSDQPLSEFADNTYALLRASFHKLEEEHVNRFNRLIGYKFLEQYQEKYYFEKVLSRMDSRAKFRSNFTALIDDIDKNYAPLNKLFNAFFPQVISLILKEDKG